MELSRNVIQFVFHQKKQISTPTLILLKCSIPLFLAGMLIGLFGSFKEDKLICDFSGKVDQKLGHSECAIRGLRTDYEGKFDASVNNVQEENTDSKTSNKLDLNFIKHIPMTLIGCTAIMIFGAFLSKFLHCALFVDFGETIEASDIAAKFFRLKRSKRTQKLYKQYILLLVAYTIFLVATIIKFDLLFGQKFVLYGFTGNMNRIFETSAICDIKYSGDSGEIDVLAARCSIPLNLYYENYFTIVWWYFLSMLTVIFMTGLIWIVLKCKPSFRICVVNFVTDIDNIEENDEELLCEVCTKMSVEDLFCFLQIISKNTPAFNSRFIKSLHDKLIREEV